jgi:hypothetical protein
VRLDAVHVLWGRLVAVVSLTYIGEAARKKEKKKKKRRKDVRRIWMAEYVRYKSLLQEIQHKISINYIRLISRYPNSPPIPL